MIYKILQNSMHKVSFSKHTHFILYVHQVECEKHSRSPAPTLICSETAILDFSSHTLLPSERAYNQTKRVRSFITNLSFSSSPLCHHSIFISPLSYSQIFLCPIFINQIYLFIFLLNFFQFTSFPLLKS